MSLTNVPVHELAGLPPPIPLRVLFGNADKRLPRISADGRYYAYLADDAKGVTNVFVKRVNVQDGAVLHDAEPQQVTHEAHRPVRLLYWTKSVTRPRLLYVQDQAGNEQFHVFLVDFEMDEYGRVQQLSVRDLTPFDNVTVMSPNMTSIHLHKRFPDKLLVTLNKRDKRLFDLHSIDLSTGQDHVLMENPGDVANWIVNDEFHVWGCATANPKDGSMTLRVRSVLEQTDAAQWKTIAVWPHGETGKVHAFSKDAHGVYVETSIAHSGGKAENTNTSRLVLLSTADGSELEVIAQDPLCDLERVSFNEDTWRPQFVSFEYLTQRIEVLDADVKQDIEALQAICVGSFYLVSASDDNRTWIVAEEPDNGSMKYYIYDRETRQYALLFDTRPELASYQLVRMRAHVIKTSDGEDMVAYLSLPHGVKAERLPFVLNVHGGPWGRNTSRFDPMHQFFANRGYGCLSVNFRGSVGFGKRWVNLGDLQWGGNMQHDLTDAVHWAISQGYADKDRVAIYGGSYGGYAVLAGLAFTPDLFVCGVDIVGPSNLQTLLAATPTYWETMRKMLTLRIGPVETDPEFNERVSPLFHANNMRKPLLIAQGANDPRVKQSESDQIARKLFANKHEVQYVVYKDEGHGFARAVNKLHFTGRVEAFLAEHLGGRLEPLDASLIQGHSAVDVDVSIL